MRSEHFLRPNPGLGKRDLETLMEAGCNTLAFGPRIMRTETAAPALQAIQRDTD